MSAYFDPSICPFAFGGPSCSGLIRVQLEDFRVDEIPLVEPSGAGEHVLLHIEKRGSNSDWVAGLLARHAGVLRRDVSFAGRKDRYAVTRQWFSVRVAARQEPVWSKLDTPQLRILEAHRHSRKLRTGALRGNRFRLRVRQLNGDHGALVEQLVVVAQQGIPNYFGEQRFGRNGANLAQAEALFSGKLKRVRPSLRGIYFSAARALLFNKVLAVRVQDGSWNRPLTGERLILNGSRSSFLAERIDDELLDRHRRMDLHTSGPLWGKGESGVTSEIAALESQALADDQFWQSGLERSGLEMGRRALRAAIMDLAWEREDDNMIIEFSLPKGSFATALLRECVTVIAADNVNHSI